MNSPPSAAGSSPVRSGSVGSTRPTRDSSASRRASSRRLPIWRAIAVGVFQTLALIPGVSRSGATIFGGLLLGLDRRAAAEFSFFLAMPTMAAAFLHDFLEVKDHISSERIAEIAVGFIFAFISALIVVKPFLNFVTRVGFAPFAWYRIVAGAALLGVLAMGMVWVGEPTMVAHALSTKATAGMSRFMMVIPFCCCYANLIDAAEHRTDPSGPASPGMPGR